MYYMRYMWLHIQHVPNVLHAVHVVTYTAWMLYMNRMYHTCHRRPVSFPPLPLKAWWVGQLAGIEPFTQPMIRERTLHFLNQVLSASVSLCSTAPLSSHSHLCSCWLFARFDSHFKLEVRTARGSKLPEAFRSIKEN